MPHIHDLPGQHDFTASAFIVRLDMDEPRLMVHMHKRVKKLMQPGGHVELSENIWQSICHEIEEETGYELDQLEILQPEYRIVTLSNGIVHPQPVIVNTHATGGDLEHYHVDSSYAFTAYGEPVNKPGEGESTDIRWFSEKDLVEASTELLSSKTREVGLAVLRHYLIEWKPEPVTGENTRFQR